MDTPVIVDTTPQKVLCTHCRQHPPLTILTNFADGRLALCLRCSVRLIELLANMIRRKEAN